MLGVKDHLGNEYGSKNEMLEKYGVGYETFRARMKSGKSLEEALTTPVKYTTMADSERNKKEYQHKYYMEVTKPKRQRIASLKKGA